MADQQGQLQEAFALIKSGREKEAVALLMPILKADRDNANAWWLMANALEKPDQVRGALEQVLRLRPDNTKAQQMLVKINTLYARVGSSDAASAPPPAQPRPAAPPQPTPPDPFDDPFAAPPDRPATAVTMPKQRPSLTAPTDPFAAPDDPFAAAPPPQRQNPAAAAAFVPIGAQKRPAPAIEVPDDEDDPFASPPPQKAATINDFIQRSTQTFAVQQDDDPFEDDLFPDDPFGDDASSAHEDIFAGIEDEGADPFADVQPQRRKSNQPNNTQFALILVALAVVGVLLVVGLIVFTGGGAPVAEVAANVAQEEPLLAFANEIAPQSVRVQGVIALGEAHRGRLNGADKHGWAFEGRAGQMVVIDMIALGSGVDPDLTLIAPDGSVVAQNDDTFFPENFDSRIEVRLPQAGVYLIIAQDHFELAFDSDYELRLATQ